MSSAYALLPFSPFATAWKAMNRVGYARATTFQGRVESDLASNFAGKVGAVVYASEPTVRPPLATIRRRSEVTLGKTRRSARDGPHTCVKIDNSF